MSDHEATYRHELKYPISTAQLQLLKARITGIMQPDPHAGDNGSYTIRSLYFDDYYDTCFHENENGTDPREKYRIRIYNGSSERIMLERKQKRQGKALKTACPLTLEQTQSLMEGLPLSDDDTLAPLLQALNLKIKTRMFRPSVIVEYERIPYIYRNGNVRVTFDLNISSGADFPLFLSRDISRLPIMPAGMHLLEVKFDEYLPDFIYSSLNLNQLRQTAFSKYYLCKKLRQRS